MGISNAVFEYGTNLQYKVKSLTSRVQSFESGEKYVSMRAKFERQLAAKDREIKKHKLETANARVETVTVRNNWLQVMDDLQAEHSKEMRRDGRIIKALEERALRAEKRVGELKDENLALRSCAKINFTN
jgi:hypothetical protein